MYRFGEATRVCLAFLLYGVQHLLVNTYTLYEGFQVSVILLLNNVVVSRFISCHFSREESELPPRPHQNQDDFG